MCVNSFDESVRKKLCKKVLVNSDRLTQVFKYLLERVGNSEEEELAEVCMTSTWLTQVFR